MKQITPNQFAEQYLGEAMLAAATHGLYVFAVVVSGGPTGDDGEMELDGLASVSQVGKNKEGRPLLSQALGIVASEVATE